MAIFVSDNLSQLTICDSKQLLVHLLSISIQTSNYEESLFGYTKKISLTC